MSTIKISELPKIDKISKDGMIPISDKDVQDILNTYHITLEDFTKSFSNTTWGSSLNTDLSDIKEKLIECDENLEQVELNRTNISALAQNVEEHTEQFSDINDNIDLLTGKITKNTTDISDLYTKNTEVNTKLQNIEKYDFDDLIQKITDNTSNISANTSSISTIEASVNTNTTNISNNSSAISSLQTTVETNTNDISTLKTNVQTINTKVNGLNTEVNSALSLLNDFSDDIITHNYKIHSLLNQSKASNYYNGNDYMKLDYNGSTFYDESISDYNYSDSMNLQHMYFDNDLTTFIPGLPYQDPFKALVTLKMPLAFDTSNRNSKQQLLMCQDFIWGDGQNDHEAMCPLWYERGGLSFGGATISGINLSNNIAKYSGNSTLPSFNTADEFINISFGNIDDTASGDEQLYSESIAADVTTDVFELVQNTVNISDLVGKDLALLYSKGTTAAWKFNTKYYDNTGVNIAGNLASITDIVQRFNIELSDDFETSKKIYLKEANTGKYVGYASKDFVLSDTKVVEDYYTISIDNNNNLILTTAQGYVVCYNPGSPRFKPYDRSFMESNNGYIQLYVKQEVKPEKVSPKLSWSENISLIELRLGTQSTYTNRCNTPEGLTPEYSSSNTNIATVNNAGVVTLLNPGEVTITATTQETDTYLAEAIQYKIRILEKIVIRNKPFRYLNAFIYPLIRITDVTGHTYSPVVISASDNSKTIIKEKYVWMKNTDTINSLQRSINNPLYQENNEAFIIEHINQVNKCFIGTEDSTLPENVSGLSSNRLNGALGNMASMESVLLSSINKNDTIELLTVDEDGYVISCGLSNTYDELKNNYNEYKQYVNSRIPEEHLEKYSWLF